MPPATSSGMIFNGSRKLIMKRIDRSLSTAAPARYYLTEPVASVSQGESFIIEAGTCGRPVINSRDDVRPDDFWARRETGPVYVEGIKKGDMIRIRIEDIQVVGHATGETWTDRQGEGGGVARKEVDFIEIKGDRAYMPCGLWAPVEPMIGVIYVTPNIPEGDMVMDGDVGDTGHNMDYRDICAGHSICLKARHDGALIGLGDLHAVQGWGEWATVGAECAGDVTITVTKEEKWESDRPVILKPDSFVCIASRNTYGDAVLLALNDAARQVARITGVPLADALRYVRLIAHIMNGQNWHLARPMDKWRYTSMPVTVGAEVDLRGLRDYAT